MSRSNTIAGTSAISTLLDGLIDYAGLYPPASLGMQNAVRNYLAYGRGKQARSLGRFVVDLGRVAEFREAAGDLLHACRLSVIVSPDADWNELERLIDACMPIDMIEVKADNVAHVEAVLKRIPAGKKAYFEVPFHPRSEELIAKVAIAGARIKLRMGGVVAEAIPSAGQVGGMLEVLGHWRTPFKATAGLHHPVRSLRPLNYEPDCALGTMHGFLNLTCAATLVYFGGGVDEAMTLLSEEDPGAWQVGHDSIAWRAHRWSSDQLARVREDFFNSFGSCSFNEPIEDLEAMGWL